MSVISARAEKCKIYLLNLGGKTLFILRGSSGVTGQKNISNTTERIYIVHLKNK